MRPTIALQFPTVERRSGFTGYLIIPAEYARSYVHNDPLPPGSLQGVAWDGTETHVVLVTNRFVGLVPGHRYVIFLMFTAETVPVAVLDGPPAGSDDLLLLDATMDAARVWARLEPPGG